MEDAILKELIGRLRQSDESAFKSIFQHFQQSIFNFLLYKLKDEALAEDVLQEVFLRVWKNREKLNLEKSFKSYVYTIANNLSLNALRDRSSAAQKSIEIPRSDNHPESPERIFLNAELEEVLASAIESLTEKNRVTFMMSRYENLTYREIAERLDISIKTVETRMVEALKHIRWCIKKYKENR